MKPEFSKYNDGLVPVIVQDNDSSVVLMLGFMNEEAYDKSLTEGKLCFFSRSRKKLWTKGETSGNFLNVLQVLEDCDNDTLLVKVQPEGPVCHTGADTCFNENNSSFSLASLERIIEERKEHPNNDSYTSSLFAAGMNKIAQKVGEEAVELVIESKDNDKTRFLDEAADLLFHYLVLLQAKGFHLNEVISVLAKRHKKNGTAK